MDGAVSLTAVLALAGCASLWLAASQSFTLPRPTPGRLTAVFIWLVLAALLWVSDYPVAWRVPDMVEYLAEVTFSAFRILCVTATGTVIFGGAVALLFYTRPKRR